MPNIALQRLAAAGLERRIFLLLVIVASLIFPALFALPGCSDEPGHREFGGVQPDGNIHHPVADSIPYIDRDHISLTRDRTIDEMSSTPQEVMTLADYLRNSEDYARQPVDLLLRAAMRADYDALSQGRLLVLDDLDNKLHEYDLDAVEGIQLTEQGDGPGDLHLARRMSRYGNSVNVAMEAGRIAEFDCYVKPCEFRDQFTVDELRPRTITTISDSAFAIIVTEGRNIQDPDYGDGLMRVINRDGESTDGFGKGYLSTVPIVRSDAIKDAMIEWVGGVEKYVVAFPMMPILNVYNSQGELASTFEIEGFVPPYFEYDLSDRSIRHPSQATSRILRIKALHDRYLIATVLTVEDNKNEVTFDYYLLDPGSEKGFYVGYSRSDIYEQRHVAITDHGLMQVTGDELSFIAF